LNVQCNQQFIFEQLHNFSRIFKDAGKSQVQQNVLQGSKTYPILIAKSRKVFGAQGRLATLSYGGRRFAACDQGSHWGFFPPRSAF